MSAGATRADEGIAPIRIASVGAATDIGLRRNNEDAYAVGDLNAPIFWCVLADGIGGHAGGEIAAGIAVETFSNHMTELARGNESLDVTAIERIVQATHERVTSAGRDQPSDQAMGTTLAALAVDKNRRYAVTTHLGDSRIMRWRHSRLARLTTDHILDEELRRRGILQKGDRLDRRFGAQLTRFLGMRESMTLDVATHDVCEDDAFLLASDGLASVMSDEAIAALLAKRPEAQEAAATLVADARRLGARDNVTVIVARFAGPRS